MDKLISSLPGMSGNRIDVRMLDLSGDFDSVRSQLDAIVSRYFNDDAA